MKSPTAAQLMHHPVRKLTPAATVRDAAAFLLDGNISGAPVIDRGGEVVGVFSLTDMARHVQDRLLELPEVDPRRDRVHETGEFVPSGRGFHYEAFEDSVVSDLMTPGIVSVRPDTPVEEIVGTMTSLGIHRVFVMDGGNLVGVITTMDVLRWLESTLKEPAAARRKERT